MSIHGICFDTGQSGNCGMDCEQFLDGDCECPGEFIDWLEVMTEEERQFQINDYDLLNLYPSVFDFLYTESIEDRVKRISESIKKGR